MALKDARKAIELEPEDLKGHFNLGLVWLGLENFNEAIQHLEKGKRSFLCSSYRYINLKGIDFVLRPPCSSWPGKGAKRILQHRRNSLNLMVNTKETTTKAN